MPTYEYRCNACDHHFEEFQSMSAKPIRVCPECGKRKVERLIGTGAGIIFKGSGFYETDYRSDSYKKGAEAEKPKSEKSEKGEKTKGGESAPKKGDGAANGSGGNGGSGGCGSSCACAAKAGAKGP